jgi:tryptophan halogenase
LDATAYAAYLRAKSEKLGVKRIEGKVTKVNLNPENGYISSVDLERGEHIEGDMFVDCSGFRGLLIGEALGVDYIDWSHYLAADSAQAVQTESTVAPPPYTRAIAHPMGWQWRIPLQHRTGNGIVYSSQFACDEEARNTLVNHLQGPMITEPRQIRFTTGRREAPWYKNCLAIGLSSGFLEPLESTSIHLITTSIVRLMRLLPFNGNMELSSKSYNEETIRELDAIRDFIILHYKQTVRKDSAMWDFYRDMDIPDSLQHRMEIFTQNGYVTPDSVNLFRVDSWLQVMMGQGLKPMASHGAAGLLPPSQLMAQMEQIKNFVKQNVASLPSHSDFLKQYCPAKM